MKILVLGAGGREHAIISRLRQDPDVSQVLAAPGNPGMAADGRCLPVDLTRPADILDLAVNERVDLTVVGPEAPLELGVADVFRAKGLPIVGPGKRGAELECSKARSKHFMARHAIPTAAFQVFDEPQAALKALRDGAFGLPVVIKADGLAAGKGVVIAATLEEAEGAVRAAMLDRAFGTAGARIVIEECLSGPEVSAFFLCDGRRAWPISSAQDHKRIFDNDLGPNTGGMGAFAPSPLMTSSLADFAARRVARAVLDGMRAEGEPYVGFLYVSLMLTPTGPQVIEFNVRFGDPEAQVIWPGLVGPMARTLLAAARGQLGDQPAVQPGADRFVGVVLASRGYPAGSDPGRVIDGLDAVQIMSGVSLFHSGTAVKDGRIVTAGGRVLTVVGRGETYEDAMTTAYRAVQRISFDGMQYRRDIGRRAVAIERGEV